jgi:Thiol-activated cytolysin/UvrD-like helicase C-terminal domain
MKQASGEPRLRQRGAVFYPNEPGVVVAEVSLDLGFNSKWASRSASAQISSSSTTETAVVVAYFKLVFYTVSMDAPRSPSDAFADVATLDAAQRVFTASHPPAYVRSVDYGRILMVKMETSAVDTSFNLKGAFEQATQGGVTAGGGLDTKYKDIISNASFTAVALGGAETPVQIFGGGRIWAAHRCSRIGCGASSCRVRPLGGRGRPWVDSISCGFRPYARFWQSQGPEYPAVVIPLATQHYSMLQRNLVYTGVTRGKRLVVLVGQRKALAIAVKGKRTGRRWSQLQEWLVASDRL